tara:strand:+ start:259 stop:1266 length:1008 start_codon:yes stop_codon:yes gene_type:complete
MKIGSTDITNPRIGAAPISKVFIGLDKVYPNVVDEFIFTIDTSLGDGLAEFDFNPTHYGTIDYNIKTSDGHDIDVTTNTNTNIVFSVGGVYTVIVLVISGINNYAFTSSVDKLKLTNVLNWGTYAGLLNLTNCFKALYVGIDASDIPNLSNCTRMDFCFSGNGSTPTVTFNPLVDFALWNFSALTLLYGTFQASVGGVKNIALANFGVSIDMSWSFWLSPSFNEDFTGTTMIATDLWRTWRNCSSFEGDGIKDIDITLCSNMSQSFQGSGLTDSNYREALIKWTGWTSGAPTKTLRSSVPAHFGVAKYEIGGESEDVRNYLTGTLGWTITDGGGI